ncbi:Uncharacterised protein [Streptococcus pneumoniae]|nr:Uncharacterised protein [Streptococcus pneumoniae]CIV98670.1 Uncharacterised protein [Streptococcus pneumoniae]CKN86517.1 Uncharacterised protein [Streptococcus pneumoniae]CVT60702.1 Uncharacterised protein [Streptococcus pneumoniae]CVV53214.1 Uncharacterised protein [Streptococcus pneumoniae]
MRAIKGTTVVETLEIDLSPPKTAIATKTDKTRAVMAGEIVVVFWIDSVIELTWVKVPIPKRATNTPATANKTASGRHFSPIPRRI